MLLRTSPVHNRRLRRVGLVCICLGMLLVASAVIVNSWQNAQVAKAREEHLQQIFFNPLRAHQLAPPFLVSGTDETTYAPGQTVLAFAQGFQPHEAIFVRLYSRTRGLIAAYQTRADVLGQFAAARPLSLDSESEYYTPAGGLWFQIEALSGTEQVFRFRLKSGHVNPMIATKGVYPSATVPGTVVAFWCSGAHTGKSPSIKIAANGQEFRDRRIKIDTFPITSDGLLLGTLVVSLDDPTGEWRLSIDQCQLEFSVRTSLSSDTLNQGSTTDDDYTP